MEEASELSEAVLAAVVEQAARETIRAAAQVRDAIRFTASLIKISFQFQKIQVVFREAFRIASSDFSVVFICGKKRKDL